MARTFLHALRRNGFTSTTWTLLHYPLSAALILASAAMPALVQESETEQVRRHRSS